MKTLIFCCKIVACLPLFFLLSCGDTTLPTPTPAPKDQNWYFSPLTASGVGPNGLPTKKIDVKPYCCPPDAIEITSPSDVSDGDLQWVNIPLSLPGGKINSVTVCYQIKGGGAFISQVRLTILTLPNSATVLHDDGTDLNSATPVCYTSKVGGVTVDGTITLSLRIALPPNTSIQIGEVSVNLTPN